MAMNEMSLDENCRNFRNGVALLLWLQGEETDSRYHILLKIIDHKEIIMHDSINLKFQFFYLFLSSKY